MASDNEQPTDSSGADDQPFQFSLRNLLISVTVLAVPLSFIPRLTLAWLCFAAGVAILLTLVELLDYFKRAVAILAGIIFALIGTASIVLIAAVGFGKVEGHDALSKLITSVVFGIISMLCYYLAWLAIFVPLYDNDNSKMPPPPDSR